MTVEVVAGPNIVTYLVTYLRTKSFAAAGDVPQSSPPFVRVSFAGGPGLVDVGLYRANVTVECWGATTEKAQTLGLDVAAHLQACQTFYADCTAPVDFPDPVRKIPRAVFTADVATPVRVIAS